MARFKEQTIKDLAFIESYIHASNAATGSKFDANANVEHKNVATMGNELHKGKNIEDNRMIIYRHLDRLYGETKCYEVTVSPEDMQEIYDRMDRVMKYVNQNVAPPRLDKSDYWCTYCKYANRCKQWG